MAASSSVRAAEAGSLLSWRTILAVIALAGIILVTGTLLVFNYYWLALIFFFASLFLLVCFSLEKHQYRNLLLLLIAFFFIVFAVGTWINDYWLTNPEAGPFPEDNLATSLASFVVGIGAAFFIVILPFLLLVGIATAGILKWHENGQGISFFNAYAHLLTDVLGIQRISVIVDGDTPKGKERDLKILETFGGPGWLTVYPGRVV